MKAFVLAAGLGTRLRPWTLTHPKALVPVAGEPMLSRVIGRLRRAGFDQICVNIHHFGSQIIEFLASHPELGEVEISDEREVLMDTGGALVAAPERFTGDGEPFLVHNVDILSTADTRGLMMRHVNSGADVTLLVSARPSSRRLWFGRGMRLLGWEGPGPSFRPDSFRPSMECQGYAFSGIYVVGERAVSDMRRRFGTTPFSIMDWLLTAPASMRIIGLPDPALRLLDIGKPDALAEAPAFIKMLNN